MATNYSHVRSAAHKMIEIIDQAIDAIENKEHEGTHDAERIEAFMDFRDLVESELQDLETKLEELK